MRGTLADSTRAATAMIGDFGTSRWQFYFKAISFLRRRKGPHQRFVGVHKSAVGPKRTSKRTDRQCLLWARSRHPITLSLFGRLAQRSPAHYPACIRTSFSLRELPLKRERDKFLILGN